MKDKKKSSNQSWATRHRQMLLYFSFGIVTTICSLAACYLTLLYGVRLSIFRDSAGEPNSLLDIAGSTAQWTVGVIMAFLTNKKWVFTNAPKGLSASAMQFGIFALSRVGTYFLEVGINLCLIELFSMMHYSTQSLSFGILSVSFSSRLWAKMISSVFVVIVNYFISKLIVFRKRNDIRKKRR